MRLAWLLALSMLLPSCSATGLVDDTVPALIRDGAHTVGEENVRHDIESFALSPEVRHILTQLTQDLIGAVEGTVNSEQVESALRLLISTAIDELRHDLSDVPPAMDAALNDMMHDAEAMIGRVLARSMREVRAMVNGDDITEWVRGLMRAVMTDLLTLAGTEFDDASAEHLGHWMHVAVRELMADVQMEEATSRMARAAAHGFGDGLADSLHGELGDVLHQERDELVSGLRSASTDAARPWIVASALGLIAAIVMLVMYIRIHRAHQATIHELQHGAKRGAAAAEVLKAARERGVKLGEEYDGPGPTSG